MYLRTKTAQEESVRTKRISSVVLRLLERAPKPPKREEKQLDVDPNDAWVDWWLERQ